KLHKSYQLAGECCNFNIDRTKLEVKGMLVHDWKEDTWTWSEQIWEYASDGALVHIPQGESGFLVAIGGRGPDADSYLPINQITIYNVLTDRFGRPQFSVASDTSEGNGLPELRSNFCTVLASAPDGSSHNIYLFGGINGDKKDVDGDMWVLS